MAKTVLLIRNTAPENYGGAETYQLELAKLLSQHDFSPVIITSSKKLLSSAKKNHLKSVSAPFNKTQNWSGLRNLLLPAYFLWELKLYFWYKKLFIRLNPSVVNIQSRDDWLAATLAAKKLNIRILWTDHMDFRSWVLTNVNKKFKNPIGKYLLKLARIPEKIIMISDFEANAFKNLVSPRKFPNLTIIKNGANDFYNDYKKISPAKNSFCYLGRLVDYKGIVELISAFKAVSKDFPSATLNLYGSGTEQDLKKYKLLAEENPNIIFCGFTNDPLEALAKNEIFLLPSYREGLSLSLLDAIMMKKVIIVSNVDGNPEVIIDKKTGLLVPPKDIKSLERAMRELLKNPDLRKTLSENARDFYETNFNFSKIFEEKMLPLYNNTKD